MESNSIPNSVQSVENINPSLYKTGNNHILNFASLISFIGGRHVISDFYDHRPDILCNPIIKIIILFSILYMNIKDLKVSIVLFFIYIFFIDNYITDKCNAEYLSSTLTTQVKQTKAS